MFFPALATSVAPSDTIRARGRAAFERRAGHDDHKMNLGSAAIDDYIASAWRTGRRSTGTSPASASVRPAYSDQLHRKAEIRRRKSAAHMGKIRHELLREGV